MNTATLTFSSKPEGQSMFQFYEFFAGGGMARAGLGQRWHCTFANDFDHKKSAIYSENWGSKSLLTADVRAVKSSDLPGQADLAWASFPCQDLSLAGGGAGLRGNRSGTFWPFWELMVSLAHEERAPEIIVLENVCGALSSHGGEDFAAICSAISQAGYQYGAIVVDAAQFVPQSRQRLFVVAVRNDLELPWTTVHAGPTMEWHTKALLNAYKRIPAEHKLTWRWWNPILPPPRQLDFVDIIEGDPSGVRWHDDEETQALLNMMSPINLDKIEKAKRSGLRVVGGVYKRTRRDADGRKVQRAEIRFDRIAGCLRTPAGGSSRQLIVVVEGDDVRSRLLSTREAARLMGLPDDYKLPTRYNDAYHLIGDGVVVPVVTHLADSLLHPILAVSRPAELVEMT